MIWIILLLSLILFFVGLAMIIGSGWALAIFELITQSTPSGGYQNAQETFKGSKKLRYKLLGIAMMVIGIILFFYSANRI